MPKHKCPFPQCTYETDNVEDSLAAVLISVHSNGTHTTTTQATAKAEKVKRPSLSLAGSSEEWSYFLTRWKDYTEATKIKGKDEVPQLLECCDEQLRRDVTRNAGGSLANQNIDKVMKAIKKLAVKEEDAMVARMKLHNVHQDHEETIRSFCARARGQASICKFTMPCPNYT